MTCETRLCVVFACAIVLAACGGEPGGSPTAVSITGRRGSAPSLPEVQVRLGELDSFDLPNWS
ncbi:MAG TPA: hypothetical protein VJV78_17425 [Polyangiales bacterium]|nr:hypothetical protein [Polyangiales bacterium]